MDLKHELHDLYLNQKDLDEKNHMHKVNLFWEENKDLFRDYLREIARAGKSHVQIRYIPNQIPAIDAFIPVDISFRLNPDDAMFIHELIKKDLDLNIVTNMQPKTYQYITW
jgi:hypothetical protein